LIAEVDVVDVDSASDVADMFAKDIIVDIAAILNTQNKNL